MSSLFDLILYEGIRRSLLFTERLGPILEALDIQSNDLILDAGCGFGMLAKHCPQAGYLGIDASSERIQWAKKLYPETANRHFQVGDMIRIGFPDKNFTKAVCVGLLHHLADEDATRCLNELSRIVRGRIVMSDPVFSRYHWISNALCHFDRGRFVRSRDHYLRLSEKSLSVQSSDFFYSRNGLAKFFLQVAAPREA